MRMERANEQSFLAKIILFVLSVFALTFFFCKGNFFDAVMILIMILFHEIGHIMAAKYVGIGNRGIYILPLIGGVALLDEIPLSRGKEAFISIAGPFFGLVFSAFFLLLSKLLQADNLMGLSAIMAAINLLNLIIPTNPLDGGRIFKSIAFSIGRTVGLLSLLLGFGFAIYLLIMCKMYLMVPIIILGGLDFSQEYKNATDHINMTLNGILMSMFTSVAIMWGLFLVLKAGMSFMNYGG